MKTWYDSIYGKLVVAFLLVMAPLFAISLEMNESSENSVRHEIAGSMQTQTQFYLNLLEVDFARSIALLQEYTNDDDLNKLSALADAMSRVEKTEAVNRLLQKLRLLKNSSVFLSNSNAYIPEIDRKLSSDDYNPMDRQEYERMNEIASRHEAPFAYADGRLYINEALTNSLINVEVSIPELRRMLGQFTLGATWGAVIVSTRDQWAVMDDEATALVAEFRQRLESGTMPSASPGTIKVDGKPYFISFESSDTLGIALLLYVPEKDVLGPLERYRTWYWGMSILAAIIIVIFSYSIYRIIHSPLKTLVVALRKVEKGDLTIQVQHRSRSEFRYLYDQFNSMVVKLSQLINEVYEQQFRANLSELRQLQSQINPHFLYNSFYNLYHLAQLNDIGKVTHFTRHLGSYYRFITNSEDEVTLQQEIDFAKSYAEIQMIRFEDHIEVRFGELPERYKQIMVPKLIVQPILENCYAHALEGGTRQGIIEVDFIEDESLTIVIEDNGTTMDDSNLDKLQRRLQSAQVTAGTGMINVHRRLQLKFGTDSGIRIGRGKHNGLKVGLVVHWGKEAHDVSTIDRGQ